MKPAIIHDRSEETSEAKARWFQSLSMDERMDIFCGFVDVALSANSGLQEKKNVEPASRRIQFISKT